MTRDEEIAKGLADAGVPRYVLSTTLLLEGGQELRSHIETRSLVRADRCIGVYIYPESAVKVAKARKLFYLTAKELFLSGVSVYCIPLLRLVDVLTNNTDDPAMDREFYMVENVRMVFITDFFERGAAFPLQPNDSSRLRNWVRTRFEKGNGVSFLSDAPVANSSWWPESFLGLILDTVVEYQAS